MASSKSIMQNGDKTGTEGSVAGSQEATPNPGKAVVLVPTGPRSDYLYGTKVIGDDGVVQWRGRWTKMVVKEFFSVLDRVDGETELLEPYGIPGVGGSGRARFDRTKLGDAVEAGLKSDETGACKCKVHVVEGKVSGLTQCNGMGPATLGPIKAAVEGVHRSCQVLPKTGDKDARFVVKVLTNTRAFALEGQRLPGWLLKLRSDKPAEAHGFGQGACYQHAVLGRFRWRAARVLGHECLLTDFLRVMCLAGSQVVEPVRVEMGPRGVLHIRPVGTGSVHTTSGRDLFAALVAALMEYGTKVRIGAGQTNLRSGSVSALSSGGIPTPVSGLTDELMAIKIDSEAFENLEQDSEVEDFEGVAVSKGAATDLQQTKQLAKSLNGDIWVKSIDFIVDERMVGGIYDQLGGMDTRVITITVSGPVMRYVTSAGRSVESKQIVVTGTGKALHGRRIEVFVKEGCVTEVVVVLRVGAADGGDARFACPEFVSAKRCDAYFEKV